MTPEATAKLTKLTSPGFGTRLRQSPPPARSTWPPGKGSRDPAGRSWRGARGEFPAADTEEEFSSERPDLAEKNRRRRKYLAYSVADEEFDPVLGILQLQESLEEDGDEWGGLVDEDGQRHHRVFTLLQHIDKRPVTTRSVRVQTVQRQEYRPSGRWVGGAAPDTLCIHPRRSRCWECSCPYSWSGAENKDLQVHLQHSLYLADGCSICLPVATLVGPLPWTMTGSVSYSRFLALTRPSSNFSTTSSTNIEQIQKNKLIVAKPSQQAHYRLDPNHESNVESSPRSLTYLAQMHARTHSFPCVAPDSRRSSDHVWTCSSASITNIQG